MIFVTGGTGLLGSNLLFELTKSELQVKAIYRDTSKIDLVKKLFLKLDPRNGQENFNKILWIPCDVLDITSLRDEMEACDYVYHCAAMVSFRKRDFSKMMKTNRLGTFNIVNLCLELKVKKLCYVSSTSAVGKEKLDDYYSVVETNKWTQSPQTSGYSIAKYSAEKEVWRGIEEGLNAVIINPSVIFGPGSWNESSLTIFRTISKGLKFYTFGANAFVDVRDVVNAMISLQNSSISSERFLCTGTNIKFKDLFEEMAKQLKVKSPTFFANRFLCEIAWRIMTLSRIFGKKPTLTKESVQSSQALVKYDSSKLIKTLNFNFHSLPETISYTISGKL